MSKTKEKGDKGLGHVISGLLDQEWHVAIPISEHLRYDLIAEKNGNMKRVQVKYCTERSGVVEVPLRSIWTGRNKVHKTLRRGMEYDVLAVYIPIHNIICYISDK